MISNTFNYTKLLSNADGYVRYVYWEWKFTDGVNESMGVGETMIDPTVLAVDATSESIKALVAASLGGDVFLDEFTAFHTMRIAEQAEINSLAIAYDATAVKAE